MAMLFAVMQSSKVQTAAVNVVVQEVSNAVGSNMKIGKVNYTFPNRLTVTDLYIEDQQKDTLLSIDTLSAKFSLLGFTRKQILFRRAELKHVYANIYTVNPTDTLVRQMNYDFLLKLFPKSSDNENTQMQSIVEFKNVSLEDLRLRYDDYAFNDCYATFNLYHFSKDSIHAAVNSLSFNENNGFILNNLHLETFISHEKAQIRRLNIQLPNSELALTGSIEHREDFTHLNISEMQDEKSENMFDHLLDMVHLKDAEVNLHIEKALLTPKDIGSFVPKLKKMKGQVSFTTNVTGTLNHLYAQDMLLTYKNHKILQGDIIFYGLPQLDTTYLHANLQDLSLNRAVMQDFFSDLKGRPYILPTNLAQLGNMHYSGMLDGRLDSMTLNGQLSTRLGNVTTKGQLLIDTNTEQMFFSGMLQTKRFALGKLIGENKLGNIAFFLQANAVTGNNTPISANLKGSVNSIHYNDYTYRNISLNGDFKKNIFRGDIRVDDDNLQLITTGLLDLTGKLPMVDTKINLKYINLGTLNLSQKYGDTNISAKLSINAKGNTLDNLDGYLYIDSLNIKREDKQLFMKQLRLIAQTGDNIPTTFKINSDYLNANFIGNYKYSTLKYTIQRLIAQYVPKSLNDVDREQALNNTQLNDIEFYAYFNDIDVISDVFDLPIRLPQIPTIKGSLNEHTNEHVVQVVIPKLITGEQEFDNLTLNLDNRDKQLNLAMSAYKHASDNPAGRKMGDLKSLLQAIARNDSLYLDVSIKNTNKARTEGILRTATLFSQYANKPLIDCHIMPSTIMIADSIWQVADSHIVYTVADTTLQLDNFRIGSQYEYIYADGLASTSTNDSINIQLSNILLEYILEYTNVKRAIDFTGAVTGSATAYSLFRQPMFEAEVWAKDANINNYLLGDAHAVAMLNRHENTVEIIGEVLENGDTIATVDGVVKPSDRRWDLYIHPDSVNLAFISRWTDSFLGQISGRGYGWIHVYGIVKDVYLEGKAYAQNAIVGIPFLGSTYHLNDSVSLGIDNITFDNITLYDDYGNPLKVNGVLHHNVFKDFQYEIDATLDNTLVMNLPETTTDMFYGLVFGTGQVNVKGNDSECRITATATTDKNSTFSFSTATASTAKENNFISFVDHDVVKLSAEAGKRQEPVSGPGVRVYVDVQIEATPDLDVSIVIDPKTGDKLRGRGEGNLRFQYDLSTDEVNLFGTYTLNSGTFNFTLENLFRKEFLIRPGSVVNFTGDPMNLQVDASAVYSTTASLRDLFGTDYNNVATNRSSVPVNCIIYLKENILNPVISFGIELPQSDESVASQVKSIINTDDMMMRQIIYLLVFNKFYTPEYLQSASSYGLNETYSLLTSTVTSQINNWIRQLTDNFSIGFNIRADGFDSESMQEYETQFQFTPNNRLIINGNFGYRYNDISDQPVFGNIDVEYLLTPSGMWRAKAYTHTIDKYSLREAHTQQGVGIMFKYDFNGAKVKSSKKKSKKEE